MPNHSMANPGDQTPGAMGPPPVPKKSAKPGGLMAKFAKAAVDEKRIKEIQGQTEDILTFDHQSLAAQQRRANAREMYET